MRVLACQDGGEMDLLPQHARTKALPGDLLVCEVCGQQPESVAFDPDQCRRECPFKRSTLVQAAA
jgi:hypothetical protein